MALSSTTKAYLTIHVCVLLWGATALFGRWITIDALSLVWWRMLLTAVALLAFPRVLRHITAMPRKRLLTYAGIGMLLAIHWLLFYGAIKLANASVGAICLAVAPVFLTIIDPYIARRPFNIRELLLAIGIVPGVALIVGGVPSGMYLGVAVGLASAAVVSVFGALNKQVVGRDGPLSVVCVEMASGMLLLTVLSPFIPHTGPALAMPGLHDAWLLLVLAIGCTLVPFALMLTALRHISAFGAQMSTNMEPVYAILLAIPLLGEQLEVGPQFYLGVVVVMVSVLITPLINRKRIFGGLFRHRARRTG